MTTNVYEVKIEGNDIDISGDIEQTLSRYLTNWQNKVTVELIKTEEVEEDSVDTQELLTCFKCGDKMREGDAERWYHADQDDLICPDCASVTKHTDTSLAGHFVLEGPKEVED